MLHKLNHRGRHAREQSGVVATRSLIAAVYRDFAPPFWLLGRALGVLSLLECYFRRMQQCTTNCLRLAIITLMHVQIYCANYLTLTPTCTLIHTHNFVYTYNSDPTKRSLIQLLNFGTDIIDSNNSYFSH